MNCKICQSSDLEIIDIEEKYYFCNDCEAIFIERDEIVDQKEEKSRYQNHDNSHQNKGYVKMFKTFIKEVLTANIELKEGAEVLEFGCGPGPVLADLLTKRGLNVDLYDPYFFPGKNYLEQKYDLITSTEVFEHFSKPRQEFKRLSSLLKKGAYLAVMTSFHPGPEEFKDWWYKWDPTHIVFYNQKTFERLASEFNLEIIYSDQKKYILFKA